MAFLLWQHSQPAVFFFFNAETMLDYGWEFLAPSYAVWVSYLLWALIMEGVRRSGGWGAVLSRTGVLYLPGSG